MCAFSIAAWKIKKADLSQKLQNNKTKQNKIPEAKGNVKQLQMKTGAQNMAGGLWEGDDNGRKVAPCLVIVAVLGLGEEASNHESDATGEVR